MCVALPSLVIRSPRSAPPAGHRSGRPPTRPPVPAPAPACAAGGFASVGQSPEGSVQADLGKVGSGGGWGLTGVARLQAPGVPVRTRPISPGGSPAPTVSPPPPTARRCTAKAGGSRARLEGAGHTVNAGCRTARLLPNGTLPQAGRRPVADRHHRLRRRRNPLLHPRPVRQARRLTVSGQPLSERRATRSPTHERGSANYR